MEYVAALKDIPTMATTKKINHLLDILSLSDVKKKKSQSVRRHERRVGIAQAMLNDPEILVWKGAVSVVVSADRLGKGEHLQDVMRNEQRENENRTAESS